MRALQRRSGQQSFSPLDVIREMHAAGTSYPHGTIRAEIVSRMCVNAPDNHATTWPDLRRVDRGRYVLNDAPERAAETAVGHETELAAVVPVTAGADPHGWPWEGHVQALFASYLQHHGWRVTSMADTATKARGVDVLAAKGERHLGAEVKGWPAVGYADPRRAAETKRTQPSTQAGHWFSQALMKALMLLDSQPGLESLVVLPDFPRYRDLAARTRTGRAAAGVHVVFVHERGEAASDTWSV